MEELTLNGLNLAFISALESGVIAGSRELEGDI
jgi:hypothetical protein